MHYGFPYVGSKNSIAKYIFTVLPRGERFVELFGGGAAMTHYAALNRLYPQFLYNEINPLVCNLFRDAINGKYSSENFHPYWVTKEQFHREKHTNGYVACCWSFGNDFNSYLYADNVAAPKREIFEWVVNGTMPALDYDGLREYKSEILPELAECTLTNIHDRRMFFMGLLRGIGEKMDKTNPFKKGFMESTGFHVFTRLKSLERLQCIQSFEPLERLKKIGGGM